LQGMARVVDNNGCQACLAITSGAAGGQLSAAVGGGMRCDQLSSPSTQKSTHNQNDNENRKHS